MRGRALWISSCLCLALSAAGCTLVGYGLGNIVDRTLARGAPPSVDTLRKARGRQVMITLRDGRRMRSRLVRLDCEEDTLLVLEPYRPGATTFAVDTLMDSLRVPGGEVVAVAVKGRFWRRTFGGLGFMFDAAGVLLAPRLAGYGG
ncbi:MAG: hypothetical protein U0527_13620 [Candidatus Eisenbacteria bacterium]